MHNSFVVIGGPRTGTNMVSHMLAAASPTVVLFNEVFNTAVAPLSDSKLWGCDRVMIAALAPELSNTITEAWLARRFHLNIDFTAVLLESRYAEMVRLVGIKLLYDHLDHIENVPELMVELERRRTLFIHVRRRNLLAQYYSIKIAERTGVWLADQNNDFEPTEQERRIKIYVPDLLIYFGMFLERERMIRQILQNQLTIEVEYEDFVCNRRDGIRRISNHLGYQGQELVVVTYPQNTRELSDVIENFDEVAEVLLDCTITQRFAGYFHERGREPVNSN